MGKKSKKSKKAKQSCSVLLWHKTFIKRLRQRFGLSKYQMLWITLAVATACDSPVTRIRLSTSFSTSFWVESIQR